MVKITLEAKNLCDLVVPLKIAKKLKEFNIKQQSIFYWLCNLTSNNWHLSMRGGFNEIYHSEAISAFTGDELLIHLPHRIISRTHEEPFDSFILNIQKRIIYSEADDFHAVYCVNYLCDTFNQESLNQMPNDPFIGNFFHPNILDKSFSNAVAKVLIKLIEDNVIEIKGGS